MSTVTATAVITRHDDTATVEHIPSAVVWTWELAVEFAVDFHARLGGKWAIVTDSDLISEDADDYEVLRLDIAERVAPDQIALVIS